MFTIRSAACLLAGGILAGLATGCGPEKSTAANPTRGEPIVGDQIAGVPAPTPAGTAVTAPGTATVGQSVAPTPAAPAPTPSTATPVPGTSAYPPLGFDRLAAYNFIMPDDAAVTNQTVALNQANSQIPATVKAFDAHHFAIKGFMLPLKVDGGEVTEFLLMKDQSMCCFGNAPRINEWVSVKTSGKGIKPVMDQPVSIEGTLHVGATRENGYLVGLYQMDGERMVDPPAN